MANILQDHSMVNLVASEMNEKYSQFFSILSGIGMSKRKGNNYFDPRSLYAYEHAQISELF